jgi:hypothetical protein
MTGDTVHRRSINYLWATIGMQTVLSVCVPTSLMEKVVATRKGRPITKSQAARALLELGAQVAERDPELVDRQLILQLNKADQTP